MGDCLVVEDGKVSDAREDEILEDRGGRGMAKYDEHARSFEGGLSARCPEPVRGSERVILEC